MIDASRLDGPIARTVRWASRTAADLVFPPGCHACGGRAEEAGRTGFCLDCLSGLIDAGRNYCDRCAATVGPHAVREECPECRGRRFAFGRVLACGPYLGDLRTRVLAAKSPGGPGEAIRLGRLWAALHGSGVEADCVVPVPADRRQRWLRPYHAADAVAESVARRLGVPLLPDVLRKVKRTPKQALLTAAQRRDNLRGAFACDADLSGAAVLLVDDVVTTGSTAHEASRPLRKAGAEVTVACVARSGGAKSDSAE